MRAARRARAGVGDQSLVLRQFQVELFAQERRETLLDLLGLGLWPDEPEEMIISLCRGPGYADPIGICPWWASGSPFLGRHNPVGPAGR
jgi:hypothetical protein